LVALAAWNETSLLNHVVQGSKELGIITSGISFMHVREAAPEASVLKLGFTYPLPLERIKRFAKGVDRCLVIEEGDPYLVEAIRASGLAVEGKAEMYRFGELDVARVRRIIEGDLSPEPAKPAGKPPQLCDACQYRVVFQSLRQRDCIVAGDIGCYTLAALPPIAAMDMMIEMGAAVGMGLGLRHVLPPEQARRVVSVIGDSTFVHGGLPGLVEMAYNPPPTGHVLVILDNGTTAMTGQQEHPGTGRRLGGAATHKVSFEAMARAAGVDRVFTVNPTKEKARFKECLSNSLSRDELTVIIARSPCILAAARIAAWERERKAAAACALPHGEPALS
jgi:indolepyruvate ferredoxin oxidoreductase alpha subunit